MLLKKFAARFRDKRKPTLPPNPPRYPRNNLAKPPQEPPVSGLQHLLPRRRLLRRHPLHLPLLT